jgi:6-pyruvoyl-tetrahydropterin synthase
VWVSGPVDEATGMLVDFYELKTLIDAWDHRHLNDEVEFLPTAELLATEMRRRILTAVLARVGPSRIDEVGVLLRLWETPSGYAQVGWLTTDSAQPPAAAAVHELQLVAPDEVPAPA